jgi:predicted ArsR family transcriptional regulator
VYNKDIKSSIGERNAGNFAPQFGENKMATRGRPVNFAVRGDILSALRQSAGLTLGQLVSQVDAPTVSTVATAIDRLEVQGYIGIAARLPASGRGRPQNLWTLTEAGVAMADRIQSEGFSAIGTASVAGDNSVLSAVVARVDAEIANEPELAAFVCNVLAASAAAADDADDLPDLFSIGGSAE